MKLLSKDLVHYLNDYPLESILENDKLVEQLILFGNSNDSELLSICSQYMKLIFEKMIQKIDSMENINFRKTQESQSARSHLLSFTDQEHFRISFPSLETQQYTKEVFQLKVTQASTKIYSFITLMDAMTKNTFNLFTDDSLVSDFLNLMVNYIEPLMQRLHALNQDQVRKLVFSYLRLFHKMSGTLNLHDKRSGLILAPAFRSVLRLLKVIDVKSISHEEYWNLREFFNMIYNSYLASLLSRKEAESCLALIHINDKALGQFDMTIDKVLLSVEYCRELTKIWRAGEKEGAHLSDKLEKFKNIHDKLKKAVNSLFIAQDIEELVGTRLLLRALCCKSSKSCTSTEK